MSIICLKARALCSLVHHFSLYAADLAQLIVIFFKLTTKLAAFTLTTRKRVVWGVAKSLINSELTIVISFFCGLRVWDLYQPSWVRNIVPSSRRLIFPFKFTARGPSVGKKYSAELWYLFIFFYLQCFKLSKILYTLQSVVRGEVRPCKSKQM